MNNTILTLDPISLFTVGRAFFIYFRTLLHVNSLFLSKSAYNINTFSIFAVININIQV